MMKVAFLGDSITSGYGIRKKENWVTKAAEKLQIEAVNLGIAGDTTGVRKLWQRFFVMRSARFSNYQVLIYITSVFSRCNSKLFFKQTIIIRYIIKAIL